MNIIYTQNAVPILRYLRIVTYSPGTRLDFVLDKVDLAGIIIIYKWVPMHTLSKDFDHKSHTWRRHEATMGWHCPAL